MRELPRDRSERQRGVRRRLPGLLRHERQVFGGEFSQTFKIPHLRNAYTKVGAFGFAEDPLFNSPSLPFFDPSPQGDQIRAFGYTHDGSKDSPMRFFNAFVATPASPEGFTQFNQQRQVAEFIFAFDNNLHPIVGQQITLTASNDMIAGPRIALLRARADIGECELIAKAHLFGFELGVLYTGSGMYTTSLARAPAVTDAQVRHFVQQSGKPVTYTCVPPGSGFRLGVDRDGDGYRDGDEFLAGSDPADRQDTPGR